MTQDKSFLKYMKATLVLFVGSLLTVASFNFLIDPYSLYNSPRIKGLNAKKPLFEKHMRLSKAAAVRLYKPTSLILGSSRADRGFDKSHPGLGGKNTYNLSLNGASIYEVYRYFQHANAIKPTKQAIIMLDFFMFNAVGYGDAPTFSEQRLAESVGGKKQFYFEAYESLISFDSLKASVKTIKGQKKALEDFLGDFRHIDVMRDDKNRGYREVFLRNERAYYKKQYGNFGFTSKQRDNWQIFKLIVEFAHSEKIDLRIAISPSHARQFETIAAKGLWPKFEQWKRQLVFINEQASKSFGNKPFPLWDFSGYNYYTSEAVPPLGDLNSKMLWYWDSSHFKKELGDLVLDRVFNIKIPSREIHPDFGILLFKENIESHISKVRSLRQRWRAGAVSDVLELETLKQSGN